MGKNSYSTVKSKFVQNRMKEGKTNQQARKEWGKSEEKKQFPEWLPAKGSADYDPIDRNPDSPWQDYADTSDDW